ncbi:MAG: 3-deoxy-D-manno-octulosonic acid transferase [Rhodobacteraceae bacterium]|nr:MAG: 3-deoxy-D-manno-octulosonic acid transferase [Paracoccaceae bacterium]
MSPLLRAYLAFSTISGPLWKIALHRRLKQGKEHADRLPEKYGSYARPRPAGPVIWFHALSVGESLALVPLIERGLADLPDAHIVLTTSTATSTEALSKAALPERCIHILSPIDTPGATRRFLDHWKPDLAAFSELDFWPRLMIETHRRRIPMVLINSRLPEGSLASRKRLGPAMRDILGLFDRMLVQDAASFDRFQELGADKRKISVVGALKSAARPLQADEAQLSGLEKAVGVRPIWLAAATWASEHSVVVAAHRRVSDIHDNALLIIAPRHVRDGDSAENAARQHFDRVARRSRGEEPDDRTQVYVADTIGEMGLWYRLAPVSFIGHSVDMGAEGLEGKNPFEAAALGSAILHGPSISYFEESYAALTKVGAARLITDETSLAEAVLETMEPSKRLAMVSGAQRVIAERRGVLENTWEILKRSLPED